jgi:hypothetical protein
MPSEQDLPEGDTREFVLELFALYREAHRPTLREISHKIEHRDSRATASTETIRRMLRGTTVPSWPIVESVFYALCELGNVDPDSGRYGDDDSRREMIEYRWNRALDHPLPKSAAEPDTFALPEMDPWESDPWEAAEAKADGFTD